MSKPHPYSSAAPFVVAVSGHRDLHPDDVAGAGDRLYETLQLVATTLPDSALDFLSPLADGADQLFAEQVLRLRAASATPARIRLLVPLPMPLARYCAEQGQGDGDAFAARIEPVLAAADGVYEIPAIELEANAALTADNLPYAQLERYLAIHAHLVIALWDGDATAVAAPGGTLDMVQSLVRGFDRRADSGSAGRLALPEFGRALHVPVRRARQHTPMASDALRVLAGGGDPRGCILAAGAELDTLNRRHRAALAGDAAGYGARLAAVRTGFLSSLGAADAACDPALAALARSFAVADVQAEVAKRSWRLSWIVIALGAVLAASSSLLRLISDDYGELIETLSYGGGAAIAVGTYLWVGRAGRRNAYLGYRALAEGLRVQMYWLAAGSKALVTDHYLVKQRADAGWVRDALDALTCRPAVLAMPPARVARGWIDAQLSYLEGPNIARRRRQQRLEAAWGQQLLVGGLVCALVGALVSVVLLLAGLGRNALVMLALIIAMKLLTDTGAAWLSFNGKMAHAENLRQAAHLRAVYQRADQALQAIERDGGDPADLLMALGKEILEENANWLRLYLERRIAWHGK
ncbi:hypothetical protein [Massilia sp. TWR1-2-2]|uniref:hypothetical protein n=1 Tax=Massilia sp. TWR1-2-2 TaxID=2804584 RepID=UPI003CF1CE59